MNTYYVAGIPFDGYNALSHHGIKGQRWGIRRYQNPDGTLTEAGKARYGSSREQEKLSNLLTKKAGNSFISRQTNRTIIGRTPQVKHAANQLKDAVKEPMHLKEELNKIEDQFYNNKEIYEKYLNKAVDNAYEKRFDYGWGDISRKEVYDGYRYDDWDQGYGSSIDMFKKSSDPLAKKYRQTEAKLKKANDQVEKAVKEYSKAFLGDYGENQLMSLFGTTKISAGDRLASIILSEAEKLSYSLSDKAAYPNGIGTFDPEKM